MTVTIQRKPKTIGQPGPASQTPEWFEARRLGIPANDLLFISADGHALATPDGYEIDPMSGDVYVSEVKTSMHDLTPGKIVDDVLVLTKGPGGKWFLYDNQFAKTGYYD